MAPDVQYSGLTRYQSAPSSLLESFVDGSSVYLQSSSHETETMFSRLVSGNSDSQGLQRVGAMKHEEDVMDAYSNGSQMIYNTQHPMQTSTESSFRAMSSMAAENPMKIRNENCASLVRQSSSPPGFFSDLTSENGISFFFISPYLRSFFFRDLVGC